MANKITIKTPWPPSVNRYWRANGIRRFICKEGIAYRNFVKTLLPKDFETLTGRIALDILAYPPDKRVRDLDNILKCIGDSIEEAGFIVNDNQVDDLHIRRCDVVKPGFMEISIIQIDG